MNEAKSVLSLRLPSHVKAWLAEESAKDRRSKNAQIVHILETKMGQTGPSSTAPADSSPAAGEEFGDNAPAAGPSIPMREV